MAQKTKFAETFEETLGLSNNVVDAEFSSVPATQGDVKVSEYQTGDNDLEADYHIARKNIQEILEKGNGALDQLLAVAKEDQSARIFEVLCNMINTLTASNKELVDLQKRTLEVRQKAGTDDNSKVNNTYNLNVSTAELQKMMQKNREDDNS